MSDEMDDLERDNERLREAAQAVVRTPYEDFGDHDSPGRKALLQLAAALSQDGQP